MKKFFSYYSFLTMADRVILALALWFLIWLYLHYWVSGERQADYALILATNQLPKQINLQHPQKIAIDGRLGKSLIEVSKERIRFIASPCQSKQCIHAGWLKTHGDFVACLPNQVSIELHRIDATELDSIVY
ncbi:NusG domain II-containing protein [Candidatus Parabeggiatoa sp. HSG14]|uniref:NusG domain II-containing protein n=1 Tax=Candidatus Parabeggiatoa sp. HSG14 TaxID=3055593 RepID=UPI0025A8C3BF|nr:NusG domain II-containing protein [Thiotrichales bacterium HSG14]